MKRLWRTLIVSGLAGLGLFSTTKAQAASLEIDPTYTFLKTYVDTTYYNGVTTTAGNTKAISLADLGLKGGDSINLNTSGAFNWSVWNPGYRNDMIGVFSTSDTLLDSSVTQRVVDAIGLNASDASKYNYTQTNWTSRTLFDSVNYAGSTYDSSKSAYMCDGASINDPGRLCGKQTLFDGIFGIFGQMTIQIPTDAKFLFLAVNDVFYSDNTEKMLVNITKSGSFTNSAAVPEPSMLIGAVATIAIALRMKRKQQIAQ
ncbi:hypothetical protein [Nostoc sp. FACHB-110]|uniref:hypothetical protein n=1 Tax=Nostoc sp. FACHB-110 TaxID=2692834 RepID=UPI001682A6DC|nr:hypothetical protein [Nostoc sp. FACHB-110]MBD2439018.1 hypothetical protein [Nostoc sp. FACHB-110]